MIAIKPYAVWQRCYLKIVTEQNTYLSAAVENENIEQNIHLFIISILKIIFVVHNLHHKL